MFFGCHLSATGGNTAMVKTALSIGADTFAFFTRNPRGSKAKKEDAADAKKAVQMLRISAAAITRAFFREPCSRLFRKFRMIKPLC